MRFPLIDKLRKFDVESIAVAIGPMLIALSILAIAFEMKHATDELHWHVIRVLNRDAQWIPAMEEIQNHVRNHENHMQIQEDQNAEIIKNQKEILVQLNKVKLGELMSRSPNPYAGANLSEIYAHDTMP